MDLANTVPVVAIWVADHPKEVLPILHETARDVALEEFEGFADVHETTYVRVANIPLQESIRDLRWGGARGGAWGRGAWGGWGASGR